MENKIITIKDLPETGVVFNKEEHTYSLNGQLLSGITGIIKRYICPDKYKDVPQDVLNAAAKRGTYIHELCQSIVEGFVPEHPTEFQQAFIECSNSIGVTWIATEVLLTDNKHFATAADLVANDDSLGDIKNTSVLDKDYLSWQLSIEAEFYEALTGRKVPSLWGIHVRDNKCKAYAIERKPTEWVRSLLAAAANNEPWILPTTALALENNKQDELFKVLQDLEVAKNVVKDLEGKRDTLLSPIIEKMATGNIDNVTYEGMFSVARRNGATKKSCDFEKLRELSKDIYNAVVTVSKAKDSFVCSISKPKTK